jgi:hypothetical protein
MAGVRDNFECLLPLPQKSLGTPTPDRSDTRQVHAGP